MVEGLLRGKGAIVTGAGSPIGIGHAIVLGFVRAGVRVAMSDINHAWLEQSVHEVRAIGGATNTNLIAPDAPYNRGALIQPEVMQAPAVWLASDASYATNGRRVIAYYWADRLPLEERLAKASAPAAWPQLGRQAISPQR